MHTFEIPHDMSCSLQYKMDIRVLRVQHQVPLFDAIESGDLKENKNLTSKMAMF